MPARATVENCFMIFKLLSLDSWRMTTLTISLSIISLLSTESKTATKIHVHQGIYYFKIAAKTTLYQTFYFSIRATPFFRSQIKRNR